MDSPLCTQRVRGLWSSLLSAPELEANSPPHIRENAMEEPETNLLKLHEGEKVESTAQLLFEKEEVPYKGDKNKWWQGVVNTSLRAVGRTVCDDLCDIGRHKFCVTSANTTTNRFDENENITDKKRSDSASCVPDDDADKKVEDGAKDLPVKECSSYSAEKASKFPRFQLPNLQSSNLLNCVNGYISSKLKLKESACGQMKQETDTAAEEVVANRSYDVGYFTGKLSEVYKGAGKRLQDTRDIIRNVQVGEMKVVLSQYVTMISKELPLIHRVQLKSEPEPFIVAEDKVTSVHLLMDSTLSLPQNRSTPVIPGVAGWPEGSVLSLKNTCPEVFYQKLVQLPPTLSQLQSLSSQKMLEKLESVTPPVKVNKPLSVFWLRTANRKHPIPKPGCLLLSEKDLTVLSSETNSVDTLGVFHQFNLLEIKNVQISLAGQHVRLIGCTEDTVLAVFTHNKELTQEFCKALLKVLSPEKFSEGTEDHPLLSGDLMGLSLDWTSRVPDIILDNRFHITSRFKRVLADLLYIIHGNMDGPGKPSLANICPLLYTSVKVMNSTRVHQNTIFQFLLTDTHVVLLREDGVFHPVPQGSTLVPARPQFQGLELRKRSEIRCLLVRKKDNWLVVEITFTTDKPQSREKKVESRRGSAEAPSVSHSRSQCDSWKLSFSCTSDAVILINHLCT
ncbi:uncharacterized protein LOC143319643 [Chaetodon auriga]|uniref:uncharacterized protein LOC143319643 n=1 Tax=Chaetodon auriga TaxID=39042 RepID=UPI004032C670